MTGTLSAGPAGCAVVGEMIQRVAAKDEELLAIKGLGPKALKTIREKVTG